MQDELEDHPENYRSLAYEDCGDLLPTIEDKYKSKRAENQIKNITSDRAASLSERNNSVRFPRNKKKRTNILHSYKGPKKKAHRQQGNQRYCVFFKKEGIPEQK